ncbi:hypothetical protein DAPPUDRAFT_314015 [Daphnia pulex]|uniref:Uncharacterized protein n=1 Tax=Daphnia pulex TaxID=6669 RepID=E9G4G4_DAPPU|nr:hypothetical protein DAPPUDRAFT_314015 [Daphnia pulex]|eukprot:EFX85294.1 hypothetical protein DAPPUDRAFT_314015 [Daphnia pulex]
MDEAQKSTSPSTTTEHFFNDDLVKDLFKEVEHSQLEERGWRNLRCASFHPSDPVLACGLMDGDDGRVVLLKGLNHSVPFSNWEIELQLECEKESMYSLGWNLDGTQLAASCWLGKIFVWRYPSGELLFEKKHPSTHPKLYWNRFNRDILATLYDNGTKVVGNGKELLIWNTALKNPNTHNIASEFDFCCIDWMSYNRFACGYDNGTIEMRHINEESMKNNQQGITSIIFGKKQSIVRSTKVLKTFIHNFIGEVRCVAWNEILKILASCSWDGWIQIWSKESDSPIYSLEVKCDAFSLVWSPRGIRMDDRIEAPEIPFIACGLRNGSIVLWSPLESEMEPRYLEKHTSQVQQVLFSPDGMFLASDAYLEKAIVWSTKVAPIT